MTVLILFQAGYLTIEKWDSRGDSEILTLDYPNEEVKKSISQLFLRNIYKIERYISFLLYPYYITS